MKKPKPIKPGKTWLGKPPEKPTTLTEISDAIKEAAKVLRGSK